MIEKEIHRMSHYGNRSDQYETATFDFHWHPDDPKMKNFCETPYETVLHYTINKDGSKNFIKVEIDGKVFIPK